MNYQPKALTVNIEAGVNFQIQKNQALQQITSLMQASEQFAQFMNSPLGLPVLVKNLTVYGADELQEAVPQYLQQQAEQQQQMMQMQQEQMQNDPQMIKAKAEMMKIQQKGEQDQVENQIEIAKLETDKQLADAKLMEAEAKISESQVNQVLRMEETETSHFNHAIDAATKIAEIEFKEHQKGVDIHAAGLAEKQLAHEVKQAAKPQPKAKK